MVTIIAADLVSISKIQGTCKNLGMEPKILNPKESGSAKMDDNLYIIDYIHPYGISAARRIKELNPNARIVGFYPHVRFYIKEEVEKIGCKAFTNNEFFSKAKDIIQGKI